MFILGLAGKGSNQTIFVINDQLNRYFREYGRFPRKIYLQLDGGAENANEVNCGFLIFIMQVFIRYPIDSK